MSEALDRMCEAFRPWLQRKMQAGEYLAWFAVDQGWKRWCDAASSGCG